MPEVLSFEGTPDCALSGSDLFVSYKVKAGGKTYPVKGSPLDVSLKLLVDRALELTLYSRAKPSEIDLLTLSPDGQVINEIDRDPNTNRQTAAWFTGNNRSAGRIFGHFPALLFVVGAMLA